jgi:hypothetical protein
VIGQMQPGSSGLQADGTSMVVHRSIGGRVAFYRIQRRTAGGQWEDFATATRTSHHLTEQPRGAELEFRVIAQNRAGVGMPSATVTAVL